MRCMTIWILCCLCRGSIHLELSPITADARLCQCVTTFKGNLKLSYPSLHTSDSTPASFNDMTQYKSVVVIIFALGIVSRV